jgi:DNA-binding LacI/PurR family transcriptional regulator
MATSSASPTRSRQPGVKDVAARAGVAVSTVSHVLNGTASISADVRERVMAAARELGYLQKRRDKARIAAIGSVMLAVPSDVAAQQDVNLVSMTILDALRRHCERQGIRVVPHVSEGARLDAARLLESARAAKVDGIVVFNDDRPEFLAVLHQGGLPVVLINGEDPEMRVDTVTPANRLAARQATAWLLQLGHRRILHFTFKQRKTIHYRRDGFEDAFRELNLPVPHELVVELEGYAPSFAEAALADFLDRHPDGGGVTAIFCAADNLALGCLRVLEQRGIRVPQDMSVMGFDDVMLGALSTPHLSTVHAPLDRLGPAAIQLLEQRLTAADPTRPAWRLELGCRLVERESVAAAPGSA